MSFKNSPKILLNLSQTDANLEKSNIYCFKSFRLDVRERQLIQNNKPVPLTAKAFDVLALLVERRGHLIEKNELLEKIWADSFVEEANVARIIHLLRKTLGEDENGNKYIETVAKKGYRFVADVTEVCESKAAEMNDRQLAAAVGRQNGAIEKPPTADRRLPVKTKTRFVLFAVGFLTPVFLLVLLSFDFRSDSAANLKSVKSIAVLPVKPISENRDEFYALGIADSLISRLSSMDGLIVRPLGATRKYADFEQDPLEAGREQQTDYVLAANYQIADGKIRLTAQLFNVRSGRSEGSFKIEKEAGNVFAVQDAMAEEAVKNLQTLFGVTHTSLAAKRGTTNEEAYRLFLQGKNLTDRRNPRDFRKAIEYFEQAVRLDPNYALALAWMANAYSGMGSQSAEAPREANEKAKEAVRRALELDPNLSEAYARRAKINFSYEWDFAAAEKDFGRALELEPNNDSAHGGFALLSAYSGRFDRAMTEIDTALVIDPGSLVYQRDRGRILYFARRYDEAIEQFKRVNELDENFSHVWLMLACQMKGDYAAAYETFIKLQKKTNPDRLEIFQKIYETSGWDGVKRKFLEFSRLDAEKPGFNYANVARQCALLGEKEQAFEYLNKAIEKREWVIVTMNVEPAFDSLRGDPRFDELVRRAGLK